MTICPIALAVGCKKCPAFKFCPLTTLIGDQQEEPVSKVWKESFPTADAHLEKMEEPGKNNRMTSAGKSEESEEG